MPTIQIAQIPVNWRNLAGFPRRSGHDIGELPGLPPVVVKRRIGASNERRFTGARLMNMWFVFALMTVAGVCFAVLWPLGRRAAPQAGGSEGRGLFGTNSRRSIATSPAD